ncbi:MAG: hypothetical protein R2877_07550 [Bdellovibrionota bacterium]
MLALSLENAQTANQRKSIATFQNQSHIISSGTRSYKPTSSYYSRFVNLKIKEQVREEKGESKEGYQQGTVAEVNIVFNI